MSKKDKVVFKIAEESHRVKLRGDLYQEVPAEVIAVFIEERWREMVGTYMKVGQHDYAHIDYVNPLRDALPHEYAELNKELVKLFKYDIDVLNNDKESARIK